MFRNKKYAIRKTVLGVGSVVIGMAISGAPVLADGPSSVTESAVETVTHSASTGFSHVDIDEFTFLGTITGQAEGNLYEIDDSYGNPERKIPEIEIPNYNGYSDPLGGRTFGLPGEEGERQDEPGESGSADSMKPETEGPLIQSNPSGTTPGQKGEEGETPRQQGETGLSGSNKQMLSGEEGETNEAGEAGQTDLTRDFPQTELPLIPLVPEFPGTPELKGEDGELEEMPGEKGLGGMTKDLPGEEGETVPTPEMDIPLIIPGSPQTTPQLPGDEGETHQPGENGLSGFNNEKLPGLKGDSHQPGEKGHSHEMDGMEDLDDDDCDELEEFLDDEFGLEDLEDLAKPIPPIYEENAPERITPNNPLGGTTKGLPGAEGETPMTPELPGEMGGHTPKLPGLDGETNEAGEAGQTDLTRDFPQTELPLIPLVPETPELKDEEGESTEQGESGNIDEKMEHPEMENPLTPLLPQMPEIGGTTPELKGNEGDTPRQPGDMGQNEMAPENKLVLQKAIVYFRSQEDMTLFESLELEGQAGTEIPVQDITNLLTKLGKFGFEKVSSDFTEGVMFDDDVTKDQIFTIFLASRHMIEDSIDDEEMSPKQEDTKSAHQKASVVFKTVDGEVLIIVDEFGESGTEVPVERATEALNTLGEAGYIIAEDGFGGRQTFDSDPAVDQVFVVVMTLVDGRERLVPPIYEENAPERLMPELGGTTEDLSGETGERLEVPGDMGGKTPQLSGEEGETMLPGEKGQAEQMPQTPDMMPQAPGGTTENLPGAEGETNEPGEAGQTNDMMDLPGAELPLIPQVPNMPEQSGDISGKMPDLKGDEGTTPQLPGETGDLSMTGKSDQTTQLATIIFEMEDGEILGAIDEYGMPNTLISGKRVSESVAVLRQLGFTVVSDSFGEGRVFDTDASTDQYFTIVLKAPEKAMDQDVEDLDVPLVPPIYEENAPERITPEQPGGKTENLPGEEGENVQPGEMGHTEIMPNGEGEQELAPMTPLYPFPGAPMEEAEPQMPWYRRWLPNGFRFSLKFSFSFLVEWCQNCKLWR